LPEDAPAPDGKPGRVAAAADDGSAPPVFPQLIMASYSTPTVRNHS
jgi:hypothetical protein